MRYKITSQERSAIRRNIRRVSHPSFATMLPIERLRWALSRLMIARAFVGSDRLCDALDARISGVSHAISQGRSRQDEARS